MCGSGKLNFVIILSYFAIFKNVVLSLKPGETPSYSACHQAPNCVQLCETFLNIAKHFKRFVAIAFDCGYIFNLLKFRTVY